MLYKICWRPSVRLIVLHPPFWIANKKAFIHEWESDSGAWRSAAPNLRADRLWFLWPFSDSFIKAVCKMCNNTSYLIVWNLRTPAIFSGDILINHVYKQPRCWTWNHRYWNSQRNTTVFNHIWTAGIIKCLCFHLFVSLIAFLETVT